ncbi:MAG: hypothetical protein V3R78_10245 [Thermodesulfobacteriota bacterium]
MNFKTRTPRSKSYLAYIRRKPCLIINCKGEAIPHHSSAGGVGIKCSDYHTIPLCHIHHDEIHRGQTTFLDKYAIDLWRVIAGLLESYIMEKS